MPVIFTDEDRTVDKDTKTVTEAACRVLKADRQCFFTIVDGLCIQAGEVVIDGKRVTPFCREREI